jgi:hypothetical protein
VRFCVASGCKGRGLHYTGGGAGGGLRGGFLVFVSVCFCFFCKKVIILQVDKVGSLPI